MCACVNPEWLREEVEPWEVDVLFVLMVAARHYTTLAVYRLAKSERKLEKR